MRRNVQTFTLTEDDIKDAIRCLMGRRGYATRRDVIDLPEGITATVQAVPLEGRQIVGSGPAD